MEDSILYEAPSSEDEAADPEPDQADPPPAPLVEVHNAFGRPRGRPKKQTGPADRFARAKKCILCSQGHRITECPRPQFPAAVEHNQTEVRHWTSSMFGMLWHWAYQEELSLGLCESS